MKRNRSDRQSRTTPPATGRWTHKRLLAVIAGVIVLVSIAAWGTRSQRPSRAVPEVVIEEAPPTVSNALERARAHVVANPNSADAWGEFGMLLFAHQIEFEANECLAQAAELNPKDFRWPYLLAISLAVSEPTLAAEQFRKTIELNPELHVAHLRLGELLLLSEQLDEADQHLNIALRGNPADPRTHFNIARLLIARGNLAGARTSAEQAVQLAPDTRSVHELLAMVLGKLGERAAAVEALRRAEQATEVTLGWNDPVASGVLALRQDASSLMEHGEALLAAGQIDQAVRVLNQAINLDDRDPRLYGLLVRTLIDEQRLGEARDVLARAEHRHSQSAELAFQRANIEFLTGQLPLAEKSFRQAIALKPEYALAHYNLGHVLMKLQRTEQALACFETAVNLRPEYADAHINAAKVLLQTGDRGKAIEHLKHADRLKPGNKQVQELLEQANSN